MALGLNTSVAPYWANLWSERLQQYLDSLISTRIKVVTTASDLPPAVDWNTRMIWCLDVGAGEKRLCISDGTDWYRTDTGAIV